MGRKKSQAERVASAAAASATKAALAASGEEVSVELEEEDGDGNDEQVQRDALLTLAQLEYEGLPVRYTLHCIHPPDKKGIIDDHLTRDDIPDLITTIRDNYGAGKYVVRAVGPTGVYVKGGYRMITISSLASRRPGAPPAPAVAAAPNGSGSHAEWLQRQEVLEERRRQEAREDRKFFIQLAVTALPHLFGSRETVASIISAAKDATALTGGGAGNGEKAIEALLTGIKLGKEFNGGGDSWPAVVREALQGLTGNPATQQVLDKIANRVTGPTPPALPAPGPTVPYKPAPAIKAPTGAIPVPPRPTPQGFPEPVWLQVVLPLLTRLSNDLLEFAQNGADPGLAAEALVGKIPRTVRGMVKLEQLKEWLTNPNWWTLVKDFKPELEPYQGYCDDVRQSLYKLYMTEPESEPEQP